MSIIEQAALRLDALRRAGVSLDAVVGPVGPAPALTDSAVADTRTVPADSRRSGLSLGGLRAPLPGRGVRSRRVELDLAKLAGNGYVTPMAPRSRLAEEFRAIKRPLLAQVSARTVARSNTIMVTSALAGEGKTFTAINLAMSLASELERRVLLVDADVLRPSILDRLGLPSGPGLMEALADPHLPLSDVLIATNVEKLTLLPAGAATQDSTELLSSETMRSLIDDLAQRYADRIIVFDTPPLLLSNESRVLARHVGQIVVVTEALRTPQASLTDALAQLDGCPQVMTLLNKARGAAQDLRFGYYG